MRTTLPVFFAGFVLLAGLVLLSGQGFAAPQQAAKETPAAANPNQVLVNRYCVTCHNQRLKTAKLALDALDLTHPEKDPVTWERAIRKLRGGMMPPPGAPRPPPPAAGRPRRRAPPGHPAG